MADRAGENAIFELFLKTKPDFAGDPLRAWSQPLQDPPDILCETVSGRRIGVELGEWLNESQMTRARGVEAIQESILAAIGRQPDNNLRNVYYAQMHPHDACKRGPCRRGSSHKPRRTSGSSPSGWRLA